MVPAAAASRQTWQPYWVKRGQLRAALCFLHVGMRVAILEGADTLSSPWRQSVQS